MSEVVVSHGTDIYFIDPANPTEAIVMECPTGVSKSGGARNMIEVLCLGSIDPVTRPGSRTSTTYSVPFALVDTDQGHQRLYELEELGVVVPFAIALAGGTEAPTVVDGQFEPPTDRTSFIFDAVIEDVSEEISPNDVVRGTLTLRVAQDGISRNWKSA